MSSSTSMGSFVGGSTSITGSSCCSLPEIATAETPLELLPRVVGMLGVCCLVCGAAMCASSACGVCDLFVVVLCAKIYTGRCCCLPMAKRYFQNRNTSDLIQVRLYSELVLVLMSFTYVFVFVIICSS